MQEFNNNNLSNAIGKLAIYSFLQLISQSFDGIITLYIK